METKDKDLLFKDLCARLPYGVQCQGFYVDDPSCYESYIHKNSIVGCAEGVDHIGYDDGERYITIDGYPCELGDVKPYLRPMSSMTEHERFEYLDFLKVEIQDGGYVTENYVVSLADMPRLIDWLNSHHFDFRGLIDKGLALSATEGMYNFK